MLTGQRHGLVQVIPNVTTIPGVLLLKKQMYCKPSSILRSGFTNLYQDKTRYEKYRESFTVECIGCDISTLVHAELKQWKPKRGGILALRQQL